jgi:hypothetical protein
MIRIVKTGRGFYGFEIEDLENDIENIQAFIESGEPVILIDSKEEFEELFPGEELEMVK